MPRITLTTVLFLLTVSVFALQLRPFSLTMSHEYEYPSNNTAFRGKAQTGFFRASAEFRGYGGYSPDTTEVYTWNVLIKPIPRLQVLTGSIAFSGLPSRVRNPVNPVTSARFHPLAASRSRILSPGTTRTTETLGGEYQGSLWNFSLFSNRCEKGVPDSWLQGRITIPVIPGGTTIIQGSLFAGFRNHRENPPSTWFAGAVPTNEYPVLFPAAELVMTSPIMTAGIMIMRNISRLHVDTGAIRADAAVSFRQFTLGGSYFRSDSGFIEFDGSHTAVRERWLIAPSLHIRIPGTDKTTAQIRLKYVHDTLVTDSMTEPVDRTECLEGGLTIENPRGMVQCNAAKRPSGYRFSGKGIMQQLFVPWFRLDVSGSAELPEDSSSALQNRTIRLQCTARFLQENKEAKVSLFGMINQKDRFSPARYTVGSVLVLHASTVHIQQFLRLEMAIPLQTGRPEGKITLSIRLR